MAAAIRRSGRAAGSCGRGRRERAKPRGTDPAGQRFVIYQTIKDVAVAPRSGLFYLSSDQQAGGEVPPGVNRGLCKNASRLLHHAAASAVAELRRNAEGGPRG